MIISAGYNGVLAALKHGVPLICAGRTEDKADVSARVAWCGAGIDLQTDKPSEASIRNAVRTVYEHTWTLLLATCSELVSFCVFNQSQFSNVQQT